MTVLSLGYTLINPEPSKENFSGQKVTLLFPVIEQAQRGHRTRDIRP